MICRAYTSHKLPNKNSPNRLSACSASPGPGALRTRNVVNCCKTELYSRSVNAFSPTHEGNLGLARQAS